MFHIPGVGVCKSLGMSEPTQVQSGCIPAVLAGRDVVGLAHTGSGKTAAFALPMLQASASYVSAPYLQTTYGYDAHAPRACPSYQLADAHKHVHARAVMMHVSSSACSLASMCILPHGKCITMVLSMASVLAWQGSCDKHRYHICACLQALARDPYGVFALVLTPTRELAYQISEQFQALGAGMSLKVYICATSL